MYLVCIKDGKQKHTEISETQEQKITALIRDKKLPPRFNINGSEVISEEILGFTEQLPRPAPASDGEPKFRGWGEFREWAVQQEWYRKKRQAESAADTQPQPQAVSLSFSSLSDRTQSL